MIDFETRRRVALELLTHHHERLSHKASQFCGQCACSPLPLSEAQETWLLQLADKAGLTVEA